MSIQPIALPPGDFAAYLFDLDGTLADSMPIHFRAWTQAVGEFGGQFPEDLFYAYGGIPTHRIVKLLNEKFGTSMDADTVVTRKEGLYMSMLDSVQPIASVLHHVIENHGRIPLAIVSGGEREPVTRTLNALGIAHHFAAIICAEDYSKGKPDPEPFLTAARTLNVEPVQCLVFEDAEAGIASARAAGMQYVRVPQNIPSIPR